MTIQSMQLPPIQAARASLLQDHMTIQSNFGMLQPAKLKACYGATIKVYGPLATTVLGDDL